MATLPNGPIEVVFSLDTTGSMSSVLDEIRLRLRHVITRLQADIPGIKFALFVHGDYCDIEHFYVTKHVDFTDDVRTLCDFMNDVSGTGGGDVEECYEFVLRLVRERLSWTRSSKQVLIMVGDAYPHEPDYPLNTERIDWRQEVLLYAAAGVHIYGVHVFEDKNSEQFFKIISQKTGGEYIKMADFNHVCDVIMAICYRERGDGLLEGYEAEVRSRFGREAMHDALEGIFGALKKSESKSSAIVDISPPPSPVLPLLSPISSMTSFPPSTSHPLPVDQPMDDLSARSSSSRSIRVKRKRSPKKKRVAKKKTSLKARKRLRRENVPHSNFLYNNLKWSPWRLAVKLGDERSPGWVTYDSQLRRRILCESTKKRIRRPSFYEVSVQTKPGGKRYVVFYNVVNLSMLPLDWFNVLFHVGGVRDMIDSVVKDGCRVFVRRAECVARKLSDVMVTYDYAWCGSNRREVYIRRDDVYISK